MTGVVRGNEAGRQTRPRCLEQLEGTFRGCADHRGQDDPQIVERGGEREDLEVGDAHESSLARDDDRVAVRRVELDVEKSLDVGERVTGGALQVWQVPKRQRVLEVPRAVRLEDRAAIEERGEPVEGCANAGVGPRHRDHAIERGRIAAQALERQRAAGVERLDQPSTVAHRERRPARRERVAADQGQAFAGLQLEVAEQRERQIRHRREVCLTNRSQPAHPRRLAVVERLDQRLREDRPHARRAAGEGVREPKHRCAHDVGRRDFALRHEVVPDHPFRVRRGIRLREGDPFQHPDRRRHPVDRPARRSGVEHDGVGFGHCRRSRGIERDGQALACRSDDVVARQAAPVEDHGHARTLPHRPATKEPAVAGGLLSTEGRTIT